MKGDPYPDSDAVFGARNGLMGHFVRHDAPGVVAGNRLAPPYYTVDYDFGLNPLGG